LSFHSFEIPHAHRVAMPPAKKPSPKGKKAPKQATPTSEGAFTKQALQRKAKEKAEKEELKDRAAAWCIDNKKKPADAVKSGLFEPLTMDEIKYWLRRSGRSDRAILTAKEKQRVFQWMSKSADGGEPVTEAKLCVKVRDVLTARLAYNRAHKHGAACTKLSKAEKRIVSGGELSHIWIMGFNAEAANNGIDLKPCRPKDNKRHKKQNEHVVENHFYGEFGLKAELIRNNNLDLETGRILDPRRLLNSDEKPLFLDYQTGKLTRAYGKHGVPLERSGSENRETATLNTAADLSGFRYGLQAIVGRKHLTHGMADCCDAPEWAPSFDDSILLADGLSTYGMIAHSEHGIQTKETFREFLSFLSEQIKARSEMEV
jgi:hypothetical protein